MRARWAAGAAVLALAGCVGPAALSLTPPAVAPTASDSVVTPEAPTASPVAVEAASVDAAQVRAAQAEAERARARAAEASASAAAVASSTPAPAAEVDWRAGEGVAGVDVSRYQPRVDWPGLLASGHLFTYVKATEGTQHVSPTHDDQRAGARGAGLVQGAYHYARPGQSSGTLQARFFHANGGAWLPDGRTLPGALDLEFAEEGDRCHGLDREQMVAWVREFSDEYRRLSGRIPVIYTKTEVWAECTGGDTTFGSRPLWLFDHAQVPGELPAGWERPTLWQRAVENHLDRNVFFGSAEQLQAWAARPVG